MFFNFFGFKKFFLILGVFFFLNFLLFAFFSPQVCAQGIVSSCSGAGCGLNDLVITAINIAKWILGITGSLALLMFVYGGVVLIFSGGNQERVSQGKQVLVNAVIGLVAIFATYLVIGFILSLLEIDKSIWFQGGWF